MWSQIDRKMDNGLSGNEVDIVNTFSKAQMEILEKINPDVANKIWKIKHDSSSKEDDNKEMIDILNVQKMIVQIGNNYENNNLNEVARADTLSSKYNYILTQFSDICHNIVKIFGQNPIPLTNNQIFEILNDDNDRINEKLALLVSVWILILNNNKYTISDTIFFQYLIMRYNLDLKSKLINNEIETSCDDAITKYITSIQQ